MGTRGRSASFFWGRGFDPNPPVGFRPKRKVRYLPLSRDGTLTIPAHPLADKLPGVVWWSARSNKGPEDIQVAFDRGRLACVLYTSVGAVVEIKKDNKWHYLAIQVRDAEEWDVGLCLSEACIYLDELCEEPEEAKEAYSGIT